MNQLTEASNGTVYDYDEDGHLSEVEKGEEATSYAWDPFDNLAKVEDSGGSAEYAYDALGRLTERSEGAVTRETHYGDLTDLPSYDANSEGELSTGYVRGAGGLLEEAGEASSYPLADAHGDVVTITAEGGGVSSRQSYDPWGTQLSGPSLEMGWLGAYERRADPLSGLVQMGARSYGPELGSFLSEDPVLGHLGKGTSADRYLYAWDNPLNRYDLNGRDVCAPDFLGGGCVGADDVVEAGESLEEGLDLTRKGLESAGSSAGSAANDSWDWGSNWVADRAQDYWKQHGGDWEEFFDLEKDLYNFAGRNHDFCQQGAQALAPGGAAVGALAGPEGVAPGAAVGGVIGCGGTVLTGELLTP